ncbi:MAG: hypothetical protein V4519_02620 [Patescibacteria group bacterium]
MLQEHPDQIPGMPQEPEGNDEQAKNTTEQAPHVVTNLAEFEVEQTTMFGNAVKRAGEVYANVSEAMQQRARILTFGAAALLAVATGCSSNHPSSAKNPHGLSADKVLRDIGRNAEEAINDATEDAQRSSRPRTTVNRQYNDGFQIRAGAKLEGFNVIKKEGKHDHDHDHDKPKAKPKAEKPSKPAAPKNTKRNNKL